LPDKDVEGSEIMMRNIGSGRPGRGPKRGLFPRALFPLLAGLLLFASGAGAVDLGSVLGAVGGGFLVSAVAGPLNDFINTITLNHGVKTDEATKVVPILSVGTGTRIGAAQVSGPRAAVDRTKAVGQIEGEFQALRVKALVPLDSENPLKGIRRVRGVGVSAIIDLRL
jgi:hypothetical protein